MQTSHCIAKDTVAFSFEYSHYKKDFSRTESRIADEHVDTAEKDQQRCS